MKQTLLVLVLVGLTGSACKQANTVTSPTTTTTTETTTVVTTTDTFSDVVPVGGSTSFDFTVSQAGAVTASLTGVAGTGVPATVQLRLSFGTRDDAGTCSSLVTGLVRAGAISPVTATEQPGNYCGTVADVGNLIGPATFTVTVVHS